ncbi:hypothetical protein KY314_01745 [Candidatus Woesearchaeota archaeon]|nr:hypothetical protein [Candidatus Woesearchaeota archaeon]
MEKENLKFIISCVKNRIMKEHSNINSIPMIDEKERKKLRTELINNLEEITKELKTLTDKETEKEKSYEITSVCKEDLEGEGFDISKVSDETMRKLAGKMANAYLDNQFWTDLKITADYLGIPQKNKEA